MSEAYNEQQTGQRLNNSFSLVNQSGGQPNEHRSTLSSIGDDKADVIIHNKTKTSCWYFRNLQFILFL